MESRQGVEKGPAQKFAANRLQKDRKEGQKKNIFENKYLSIKMKLYARTFKSYKAGNDGKSTL